LIIGFGVLALCGCKGIEANEGNNDAANKFSLPFLVIDLDGDGIELIPLEKSKVFFDVDGDGLAERTSWVSPDDGILYVMTNKMDRNLKSIFDRMTLPVTTGMTPFVNEMDVNRDLIFDDKDKVPYGNYDIALGGAIVWRDLNQNGLFDEKVETQGNVRQLFLSSEAVEKEYISGNLVSHSSSVSIDPIDIKQYLPAHQKMLQVQFKFEDSNVYWNAFCMHLVKIKNQNKDEYDEYKVRCIKHGFNPLLDGKKQ
jgi:hypothetical protein